MIENNQIPVESKEFLIIFKSSVNMCSSCFQKDDIDNGMSFLNNIIDNFEIFADFITVYPEFQDTNINIPIINDKLNDIVSALDNQDYILVGDLLEFEISPILEAIIEKLN